MSETKPIQRKATEMKDMLLFCGYEFATNVLTDEIWLDGQRFTDQIESTIRNTLVDKGFSNYTLMADVFQELSMKGSFNPLLDYFNGLEWDGQDHIEALLNHFTFEQENESLSRLLFKKWLVGVVVQVFEAFETGRRIHHQNPMLVLLGAQGLGKSTFVRWLTPIDDSTYHVDTSIDPHDDECKKWACSKLLWEVSELGSTVRKADRDALKSFITRRSQSFRHPWGKRPVTRQQIASFVGTMNPEIGFLQDSTGERRFFPIELVGLNKDYSKNLCADQIWAQVVAEIRNGYDCRLTPDEDKQLMDLQRGHKIVSPLSEIFQKIFEIDPTQEDWKMHSSEIIARYNNSMFNFLGKLSPNLVLAGKDVSDVLLSLGLKPAKNVKIKGIQGKGYLGIRLNEQERLVELEKV